MFYAHFVLAKKGPLARIWLAAHWDKKLTKAHVFETNIESSVEGILQPKVKMALRTSGHLLLGIVRIYSRKAKYLLADCNEAFIKIKMAFRPGVVDLPEENREAAVATITLPEVFHDFDAAMPDINNIDVDAPVTLNQSRAEDITLKEDYGSLSLMADDDEFGDMGFDDPEMARDATNIDEGFDHASLLLGEDKMKDRNDNASTSANVTDDLVITKGSISLVSMKDDGFGGTVGEGLLDSGGGLFEPGGLFDETPLGHVPLDSNAETSAPGVSGEMQQAQKGDISDDDDDMYDMGPASMGAPSGPSSPDTLPPPEDGETVVNGMPPPASMALPPPLPPLPPPPQEPVVPDQTTLIHNEDESFALAPLDSTIMPGIERSKAKRKRKLIVDEVKNISGEEMKSQLSDTSDIVTTLDLAPPTKRLMHWKETGGVEKLFALPGRPMLSRTQSRLYQRHLTTRAVENEEMGEDDRMDLEEEMDHQLPPPPAPLPVIPERPETPQVMPPPKRSKRDMIPHEVELARLDNSLAQQSVVDNSFLPMEQVSHPQMHMSMDQLHAQPESVMSPPHVPHQDSFLFTHPEAESLSNVAPIEQGPIDLHPVLSPLPPLSLHPNAMAMSPVPDTTNIPPYDGSNHKQGDGALTSKGNLNENEDPTMNHKSAIYDDDEDYGAPASVGPPEEQLADETYEQFEERIINKRTVHMLHIIQSSVEFGGKVNFRELVRNNSRKQVAQKFYTFLVLKKQQAVELEQDEPYGDLIITRGPKFSAVY